jgi:hypothetical protein
MPLRDILHKKDKINDSGSQYPPNVSSNAVPEIKFIRSDTLSHEVINPPSHDSDVRDQRRDNVQSDLLEPSRPSSSTHRRSLNIFSRSRSPSDSSEPASPTRPRGEHRLSQLLHRDRGSRSASSSSVNIPSDLPQIPDDKVDEQDREAQWEKRATILAQQSPLSVSPAVSRRSSRNTLETNDAGGARSRSSSHSRINDPENDVSFCAWLGSI